MVYLDILSNFKMKRYFILIMTILLYYIMPVSGQADLKIKKKEFKSDKAGFSQAWDHILAGDIAYIKKGQYYNNAFEHYIQAMAYNNSNAELNYKTGIAAIYTDRKEEAAGFFLKALELKSNISDDILLYTGRALQYTGKYEEASEKLKEYLRSDADKNENNSLLAKRFIEECTAAIEITKDTIDIEIINPGANINSSDDDFSPVVTRTGTTLYFASQRSSGKTSGSAVPGRTNENIYFSRLVNGKWSIAAPAGEDLNTDYNESPVYIDSAETSLYIYSGYENGGDIKVSENRKGDWRSPENPPYPVNTTSSETSIAFSPSGNEIYYVTNDGKDNLGGYDIYFIKKLTDKKWSKPQNAGATVNTEYDEQAVSFSISGDTLWFSSKGHNTMGGYDLFYSVKNQDGTWKQAVNAGFPLNTPWDELFHSYIGSSSGSFCFASGRSGGFGGFDIYFARWTERPSEVIKDNQVIAVPDTVAETDTSTVVSVSDTSVVSSPVENIVPDPTEDAIPPASDYSDSTGQFFLRKDQIILKF
jgi:tetratricopeptide (TPR) repeat protein